MSTKKNTNTKEENKIYPDEIKYYLVRTSSFYEMLSVMANSEIVFVEALSNASYLEVAELQDWLRAISKLLKKCDELKHFEYSTINALELNDK